MLSVEYLIIAITCKSILTQVKYVGKLFLSRI